MEPLFLAGHPFIDFLNTSLTPGGEAVELIGDGKAFAAWLVKAGLVDAATAAAMTSRRRDAEAAAAEARRIREWARKWLDRWRGDTGAPNAAELRELNKLLGATALRRRVVRVGTALEMAESPSLDTPADLLGPIALQLAAFITQEDPALLKRCAGHDCSLWFVDRTKAHRRLYCSAAACGNRAKVSAFRARAGNAR